ncbi:MAG: class I SAM-dependent methyltransferase [Candidatus Electrothrix scaldis]|nr:MAG: class I SAM-dependent methyltransferase [Candidatus Electrothrix sp. GW3-3]
MGAANPEDNQEFWEKMAEKYPLPFDKKHLNKTQKIIKMAEDRGVQLDGATILDIGCGTGVYTLPLAQRAAHVTGLDLSAEMILRFKKEQVEQGISNADVIQMPWRDAAVSKHQLEKAFDIVWVAMTPAVRSPEDVARLNRCARNWCVYIGWGGVRANSFLQAVFQAHDQTFGPPPGARNVQRHLAAMGINAELELFRDHWEWEGTEEEAAAHAEGMLRMQTEAEPNLDLIREITARFSTNGRVTHRTDVKKGLMVWQAI